MIQRFIFLFLFSCSLFSQEILLTSNDVRGVMDQFFALHIDHKEISTHILERSFKIYLNQFDPSHSYLVQEEVYPYLYPNQDFLDMVEQEYQNKQFSAYVALDYKIQEAIHRARAWRSSWRSNPKALVVEARNLEALKSDDRSYPLTIDALKNQHYDRFLRFMAYQMAALDDLSYEGKEDKLVALCEKQMRLMEDEYLALNENNESHSREFKEHKIILRTLKALANSLDIHTAYYSPEEAYALKVQLEKGMCGIGVVLREGIDGITIHEVIKGGPAEQSGQIFESDTIVEVDGTSVEGASFRKVLELMRGHEGTIMQLGIIREVENRPQYLVVDLVRKKIVLDDKRVDYEAEPYGDGVIGKITLHSFYEGKNGLSSEQDIKNAIDALRLEGPLHGLVLDMRDNGGGFLTQSVKVSGLFISSGVVVISKYSDGSIKYYRAVDGERYYDGPLVVLVSRGSASATEIVAGTLKDYGVAIIVGDEQTYGKGTIQHQTVTNDRTDSFFKVTVGKYYTVSGGSTQIEGVKTDILVPSLFQFEDIGEAYLEYPLPADRVPSAFDDTLADIDPFARKWFQKYYAPVLQKVEYKWTALIPQLKINSQKRIERNKNFQLFLERIKGEAEPLDIQPSGSNDLQMEESVNIIKDMIFLSNDTIS